MFFTIQQQNDANLPKLQDALSKHESALVFAFGIDEELVNTVWISGELSRDQLIEQLEEITEKLKSESFHPMMPGAYRL